MCVQKCVCQAGLPAPRQSYCAVSIRPLQCWCNPRPQGTALPLCPSTSKSIQLHTTLTTWGRRYTHTQSHAPCFLCFRRIETLPSKLALVYRSVKGRIINNNIPFTNKMRVQYKCNAHSLIYPSVYVYIVQLPDALSNFFVLLLNGSFSIFVLCVLLLFKHKKRSAKLQSSVYSKENVLFTEAKIKTLNKFISIHSLIRVFLAGWDTLSTKFQYRSYPCYNTKFFIPNLRCHKQVTNTLSVPVWRELLRLNDVRLFQLLLELLLFLLL